MSGTGALNRSMDQELAERGFSVVPHVVPAPLLAELRAATDAAVAAEATMFPPGDDQHGRVLFAPAHGGALLDLVCFDPLFVPMEDRIGSDTIIYTMTTSVLQPNSAGPVHRYHVDLTPDRGEGVALGAMVMLDDFRPDNGATEFVPGSHRWADQPIDDGIRGELLCGSAGDVCYFDPRIHHRSTRNTSEHPRRSVLVQMIRPWMKQRFDVAAMLGADLCDGLSPVAARRLGLTSVPPGSADEFLHRRRHRPWT